MRNMKNILSFVLASAMLTSALPALASEEPEITVDGVPIAAQTASPEETAEPASVSPEEKETASPGEMPTALPVPEEAASASPAPSGPKSSSVTVHITMEQQPYTIDSFAKLELYSKSGELLDFDALWVGGITTELTYTFDVPEYTIGESFTLKLADGLSRLRFYDSVYGAGSSFDITTYTYTNENGESIAEDSFEMSAVPCFQKSVSLRYDGVEVPLSPGARVIDGVTMVPVRQLAQYIGMDSSYNPDYNVEVVSLGSDKIYFNIDTDYTTVFGTDLAAQHKTLWLDGAAFVALRTFSDALGSTLDVTDNYTSLSINMTASQKVNDYFNNIPVNSRGISSRTDYLIWVSLSEYKVRVYLGKQYQWKPIREATCAIGAPGTPTITGSYEYQYSMPRWDYGTYYVGPCMIFYGGYALHSVFLYQDGSEYDGRVGMKLSHGCVRLKKADIDWLYSMIPVGTRIYITP